MCQLKCAFVFTQPIRMVKLRRRGNQANNGIGEGPKK